MTVDHSDLMCVLDQRARLDDILRRKKRHANETGGVTDSGYAVVSRFSRQVRDDSHPISTRRRVVSAA
jgi:hypothetical protein